MTSSSPTSVTLTTRDTVFTAAAELIADLAPQRGIWIGGTGLAATDRRTMPLRDPATGHTITEISDGSPQDAAAAVDAAVGSLAAWSSTAPRTRSEVLRAAYELMTADADPLAELISWENGKALADSRAEVFYAAEFFRWFSEEAVRPGGGYGPAPAGGARTIVAHSPVGVCALVTPWNFPAAMATRKIAPALAAGCTVVLKPAAETPLTALAVARILTSAGVPDGVVQVVPTSNAVAVVGAWLDDARVRKLSFTGSTQVGRTLLAHAARRVMRTSMELGGNAPFIVTADADVDRAVDAAMVAKFRNGGQACTAANRFYVHERVYASFRDRFGSAVERLRVGPASDPMTQLGPLISDQAVRGVEGLVQDAVRDGARISHRAPAPTTTGSFYPPTVLADVPADARILQQEIFGPVAPLVPWTGEAEMLEQVNASEFGLVAYVMTGDGGRGLPLAERLEAGMVAVNRGIVSDPSAPFGGVKQSGLGREGAREGLHEFLETRYVSLDWP